MIIAHTHTVGCPRWYCSPTLTLHTKGYTKKDILALNLYIYIYISKELSKENKRRGERYSEKSKTQGNNSQFQIKWILAFSP